MPHPLHAPVTQWFAENGRDLPWRRAGTTPWGVLVSEVMLQQTPVVRAEPVWRDWMRRWPDPADLARASTADVLRAWGRLGYPRRALRLQECARVLTAEHGGTVPSGEADLLALPGVGTYTAAAVLAFAHGRRAVVLDTNVRRVLARAVHGEAFPVPHLTVGEVRAAEALVPPEDADAVAWSAATMELGALVCTARAPACERCPIRASCAWLAAGRPPGTRARRAQPWAGTDRQVRGALMALLRTEPGPVAEAQLLALAPEPAQGARCLASLIADGLVAATDGPVSADVPGSTSGPATTKDTDTTEAIASAEVPASVPGTGSGAGAGGRWYRLPK